MFMLFFHVVMCVFGMVIAANQYVHAHRRSKLACMHMRTCRLHKQKPHIDAKATMDRQSKH